jgi:CRP/FNR family transcriptional regulator, cyclic AMP receptor protein
MREFAYIHEEGTLPMELRTVPFLNSFSDDQLDDVLTSSNLIQAEEGDTIIQEGSIDSRIYVLLSGRLDVKVGQKLVASITRAGEVFGELALINQDKRLASVVAGEKAICLAVDQKFLQDLRPREEDPEFHASMFEFVARLIAKKLVSTSQRLGEVERELAQLKKHNEAKLKKAPAARASRSRAAAKPTVSKKAAARKVVARSAKN